MTTKPNNVELLGYELLGRWKWIDMEKESIGKVDSQKPVSQSTEASTADRVNDRILGVMLKSSRNISIQLGSYFWLHSTRNLSISSRLNCQKLIFEILGSSNGSCVDSPSLQIKSHKFCRSEEKKVLQVSYSSEPVAPPMIMSNWFGENCPVSCCAINWRSGGGIYFVPPVGNPVSSLLASQWTVRPKTVHDATVISLEYLNSRLCNKTRWDPWLKET